MPVSVTNPSPGNSSAPGRVTLADRSVRGNNVGVPDISGMPRAENPMMFTGYPGNDGAPATFVPNGGNFCAQAPVGCEPCGTTIHATGPSGFIMEGGLTFYHVRRSDPSILFQTTVDSTTTSVQSDYQHGVGVGFFVGAGYLTKDGWFGMLTWRQYTDTISQDRFVNDGFDPNLSIQYIGPGPLGSGAGGGDILGDPPGGSIERTFGFDWTNIDAMGGTVISPAKCLDVIFAAGVRYSKLQQTYDVFVDRNDGNTNAQNLWTELQGAGPRFGVETRVYPLSPLMFYAKAYSSLLLTHRREQAYVTFTSPEAISFNNSSFSREEVLPSLEVSIGGEIALFGGRVLVGGGYDFNYLWEAGSTYTEQSTNPRSARHVNLAVDGASVHFTFLW